MWAINFFDRMVQIILTYVDEHGVLFYFCIMYIIDMIYKYNDPKILRLNSKKFNQIMFY